jgi:hypothetical protein
MPAPPALIENAIRSAAAFDGSADDAALILKSGLSALGGRENLTADEDRQRAAEAATGQRPKDRCRRWTAAGG